MVRPVHTRRHVAPWNGGTWVALLLLLGCSDQARIGGLCPTACIADPDAAACASARCPDSNPVADAGICADAGCGQLDGGTDASLDGGKECLLADGSVRPASLELLLVVDDAASLAPAWAPLRTGLFQFLAQQEPSGLAVGLWRFADVCDAQAYAEPIVPVAPLSENLGALDLATPVVALASTSTIPALGGVLAHARARAAANPGSHVAVLLITDGTPGACDALSGIYDLEAQRLAREALEGTPSIATYVIAVGALPTAQLIAQAGGTLPAALGALTDEATVLMALEGIMDQLPPVCDEP